MLIQTKSHTSECFVLRINTLKLTYMYLVDNAIK